jgi:hypothetical protein
MHTKICDVFKTFYSDRGYVESVKYVCSNSRELYTTIKIKQNLLHNIVQNAKKALSDLFLQLSARCMVIPQEEIKTQKVRVKKVKFDHKTGHEGPQRM